MRQGPDPTTGPQSGIKSPSSNALIRTRSRRIPASASTNQEPQKGDSIHCVLVTLAHVHGHTTNTTAQPDQIDQMLSCFKTVKTRPLNQEWDFWPYIVVSETRIRVSARVNRTSTNWSLCEGWWQFASLVSLAHRHGHQVDFHDRGPLAFRI